MKRVLKWTGILLLVIIVCAGAFVLYAVHRTESRLSAVYTVDPPMMAIASDSASLERGSHLAHILCANCHGNSFEGTVMFNDPALAVIQSPNLTLGKGGIAGSLTEKDWVRAIRHGVSHTGRPLFVMPARDMNHLSPSDVGAIIGYMKSVEPVDHEYGPIQYGTMGKILLHLGAFGDVINAETIDHSGALPPEPVRGPTTEYGSYIVAYAGCRTCHGEQLNGGKDPNPHAPMGPNLTPGGNIGKWDQASFTRTLRSGITPEGKMLQAEFMPWKGFGQMDDDELAAVYTYLRSLEARPTAEL